MTRRSRARPKPTDPQDIQRQRILRSQKALQQTQINNPDGGISGDLVSGDAGADVQVRSRGGQVLSVQRSHAFSAVGLGHLEQEAADRYLRDWAISLGVRLGDNEPYVVVDNNPGLAPGQNVTQRMIDAGSRLARVHRYCGLGSARLLEHLVRPVVAEGAVRVWRVLVKEATGVDERHAQGVLVRQAVNHAMLAYREVDREDSRSREVRRGLKLRLAGGSAD
jgi:hypothetical protein